MFIQQNYSGQFFTLNSLSNLPDSNKMINTDYENIKFTFGIGFNYNLDLFYFDKLYSIQVIPRLYKNIYLNLTLNVYNLDKYRSFYYNVTTYIIGISPLIDINIYKNIFKISLDIGPSIYIYGSEGGEISIIPSISFNYNISKLIEIGIESRIPIFIYKSTKHNQIISIFNISFKL